jgi:thiol:disulfide interchange protein DsbD
MQKSLAVLLLLLAQASWAAADKVALRLELDRPEVGRGSEAGIEVFVEIERGWHINSNQPNESYLIPTVVELMVPEDISSEPLNYPPPDPHKFAFAPDKTLLVYSGKVGITGALAVPADFPGDSFRVQAAIDYQACNDTTCLPPASTQASLVVPVSSNAVVPPDVWQPPARETAAASGLDVGGWMRERGLVVTLLLMVVLGLGLNLTPCVYPLISVTIAFFGTQSQQRTVQTAGLALVYVLGITLSFSAVGVVAALSGGVFGAALQKPSVLIAIAALLVTLALSSFGVYQLRPPTWLLQRASGATQGAFGAFFMGLTMGVVAAPCVGPVVIGLLVFVGSQQDALLGFELFFALGLGMGLPYVALAIAAGSIRSLPRSGEWLLWVEHFFGCLLLGLALYFVSPLFPAGVRGWLLPTFVAVAGLYLGFFDRAGRKLRYFLPLQRALGIAAVVVAVWVAWPRPAESTIAWQAFAVELLEQASAKSQPVIVDFVADWCIPCHEMDATTFTDPKVLAEAGRFAMFKADITRETELTLGWVDAFDVQGVPTMLFIDSRGNEIQRLVGYVGPEEMIGAMRRLR